MTLGHLSVFNLKISNRTVEIENNLMNETPTTQTIQDLRLTFEELHTRTTQLGRLL